MTSCGDFLEDARLADRELARQITREARRSVPAYVPKSWDIGPTEAWRMFLAETDPEWDEAV